LTVINDKYSEIPENPASKVEAGRLPLEIAVIGGILVALLIIAIFIARKK